MPSSQGGEADGQFDRVIRSVLDAKGFKDVRVVAPDVELLPCNLEDADGLFLHMLAGDVLWAAAPDVRPALRKQLLKPNLTLEDVLTAATTAAQSAPVNGAAAVSSSAVVAGEGLRNPSTVTEGSRNPATPEDELRNPSTAADESWNPATPEEEPRNPSTITDESWNPLIVTEGMRNPSVGSSESSTIRPGGTSGPINPASTRRAKTLAVVGEWPLVIGDELVGGMWGRLEAEGYRVRRAPFAEYLWFIWEDGCDEAKRQKVTGGLIPMMGETGTHAHASHASLATGPLEVSQAVKENPLFGAEQRTLAQDVWHEKLDRYANWMQQVSDALGSASTFSADRAELRSLAADALGSYAAGNGRYRYAKAVQAGRGADGVIVAASMYENTDIMLRLKGIPSKAPLLHLAFDGALDQSIEDRLRSFLYYV